MKNKKIIHNQEIHEQNLKIDLEYRNKIDTVLNELLKSGTLDDNDVLLINGTFMVVLINCSIIQHQTLYHYNSILKESENVWHHISKLYDEGSTKIKELSLQFQKPKKMVTIDNMETKEEFKRLFWSYLNSLYPQEEIDELCKKGHEMNIEFY